MHVHERKLCSRCHTVFKMCKCVHDELVTPTYGVCDKCVFELIEPPKFKRVCILAYTDMPFEELGDKPYQVAPIRQIELLAYDGNKYVTARNGGVVIKLKSGYVYTEQRRCSDAERVSYEVLDTLPFTWDNVEPTYVEAEVNYPRINDLENLISDTVSQFLYYDRKEDEDLPLGAIEDAVDAGILTVDELTECFRISLSEYLE